MAALALRNEERIGLGVAIAAHAALVALILWRPPSRPVIPPPERMTVTLSDEVGLTSAAPAPAADAAPDLAPEIGEPPPPEPPAPVVQPELLPQPRAAPVPQPRPAPRVAPPQPQPRPQPSARPTPRQAQATPTRQPARNQPGASRIGSDFLKGAGGSSGKAQTPPAQITGAVQASLRSEISRQLKPHWTAPQGADAEQLVTLVRFQLAKDGSLIGSPEVVGQSGVTPANAPQKARHAEQAVRAVRLAAPFKLPVEFYSAWQSVTSRFDRRLSQ